jgi:methylated-DNA-[protein]-cysteine S-methyltransferase
MTADMFTSLSQVDEVTKERLHARLVADAEAEGIVDVAYRTLDSPVGSLLLAATQQGLVRIAFARQDHDTVLTVLSQQIGPRILRAPQRLDEASRQLEQYFTGQRTDFDVPLDLRLANGFRRDVLTHLRRIGYGRTESYAQVATAAGNAKAVRAVGTACKLNPLPLIVPCHRVVRSDGSPGEYAGGAPAKHLLLELEGRHA